MEKTFKGINAFLIDLDGVIYIDDEAIPGAVDAVNHLIYKEYPILFITNTTTKSPREVFEKLIALGIRARPEDVLSTPMAALKYLREEQIKTCFLLLNDKVADDFVEFDSDVPVPDAILIGDIGNKWNYDLMNKLFKMLMGGSRLITLHKGKYWRKLEGLTVDIGAFIAGLEFATGVRAEVVGKPSPALFDMALNALKVAPENAIMIGDDIDSDIGGAASAGIKGILVKTGKYDPEQLNSSKIKPWMLIDSIAELPDFIKNGR